MSNKSDFIKSVIITIFDLVVSIINVFKKDKKDSSNNISNVD